MSEFDIGLSFEHKKTGARPVELSRWSTGCGPQRAAVESHIRVGARVCKGVSEFRQVALLDEAGHALALHPPAFGKAQIVQLCRNTLSRGNLMIGTRMNAPAILEKARVQRSV